MLYFKCGYKPRQLERHYLYESSELNTTENTGIFPLLSVWNMKMLFFLDNRFLDATAWVLRANNKQDMPLKAKLLIKKINTYAENTVTLNLHRWYQSWAYFCSQSQWILPVIAHREGVSVWYQWVRWNNRTNCQRNSTPFKKCSL